MKAAVLLVLVHARVPVAEEGGSGLDPCSCARRILFGAWGVCGCCLKR